MSKIQFDINRVMLLLMLLTTYFQFSGLDASIPLAF